MAKMLTKSVELTAKQKTHTLSAKKKKSKKTVRNVLAQPFPRYWPQLDEEQSNDLFKLLLNIREQHPEWFAGKKATNEMWVQFKFDPQMAGQRINLFHFLHHLHSNKSVYCGLQASIRKLKSGNIKLLVLSADLKPRYVANQIIVQALANNADIRILCVANMAAFTQNLLNFPCYALVVGHEHWLEMSELNAWTANIIDVHFPIPGVIKEHYAKQQDSDSPMEVDEPQKKKQKELIGSKSHASDVNLKHLHLTRNSCDANQRAFVPNNAINLKPIALEIESLNKIKSDFISLETYNNSNDEASTSFDFKSVKGFGKQTKTKGKRPLAMYRELTIHKIQNNPNKVKKIKDKKKKKKNLQK